MLKWWSGKMLCLLVLCAFGNTLHAQQPTAPADTFFLVKKKGLLGQLGKSISTYADETEPAIKVNPYLPYQGKIIRRVRVLRLGFERSINDTTRYDISFGTILTNGFHKKTTERVIRNNLFFNVGDTLQPYLLADNERHFREQPFIQDAMIVVENERPYSDSLDILVLVKDVFSLGGSADISNIKRFRLEVKDENFRGSGSRLSFSTFYDRERTPRWGYGVDFIKRNLYGSFVNWTAGFKTYNSALTSGKREETVYYTSFDKPLVTPYLRWIGGADFSFNQTNNNYSTDSFYKYHTQYTYYRVDSWVGYNFGRGLLWNKNAPSRVRRFGAIRGFYQRFDQLPGRVKDTFDYRYSNINGFLASYIIFKQNFIRTNFIYGFGRTEDVPEGFNISAISGWISKKDSISNAVRSRPYYGIDATMSRFNKRGFFSNFTFRLGGFTHKGRWEDLDILFNVDHFTRRRIISPQWFFRQFVSAGFTRQFYPVLNPPLNLNSIFGLPYFNDALLPADMRATVRTESVFYHMRKFWGFRIAPFIFGDICLIKPTLQETSKSQLYGALGAGIRTRNENLIFGTIELRGFYFPRTVRGMSNFQVELGTNIRFKYNSTFIRKPDFVNAN
ncbi:MAG: hypothetical protein RL172_226 [Bacteroidota bacterium]|jgi:hypothetical protein